ncbi:MAG: hypothetical protein AAGA03_07070 [Planctomycetota bacterium]
MNRTLRYACWGWLTVSVGVGLADEPLSPTEVRGQIEAASRHLDLGETAEAERIYRELGSYSNQPELVYNHAVAAYQNGERDAAGKLFARVVATAGPELAAKARYNLGNLYFEQAVALASPDEPSTADAAGGSSPTAETPAQETKQPPEPTALLEVAIRYYYDALRLDPSDDDARANAELAHALLKKLRQQSESASESKNEPRDSNGSGADQGEPQPEDSDRQEGGSSDTDSSQVPEEEKQSPGDESPPDSSDDSDGDQQGSDSEPGGEDQRDESQQGNHDQQPSSDQRQRDGGEQGSQRPPSSQPDAAKPDAEEPGDDPAQRESPAKDSENAPRDEPVDGQLQGAGELPDSTEAESESKQSAMVGRMTRQEAEKMLQAIRDRAMLRHRQLERLRNARRYSVEKDW